MKACQRNNGLWYMRLQKLIFEDFDELLEEIHEGGKKIKKNVYHKKLTIILKKIHILLMVIK